MRRWLGATILRWLVLFTGCIVVAQGVGQFIAPGQIAAYSIPPLNPPDLSMHWQIVLKDMDRNLGHLLGGKSGSGSTASPEDWSDDGQQLAMIDHSDIYVLSTADYQIRNVSQSPDFEDYYPKWSPDGQHIAFLTYTDRFTKDDKRPYVGVLNVETGRSIYNADADDIQSVSWRPVWSSDGKLLAYGTRRNRQNSNYDQLEIVKVTEDELIPQITLSENAPSNPQWSPTGNWLAYETYKGDFVKKNGNTYLISMKQIWIADGYTGEIRKIADDYEDHPAWSPDGRQIAYTAWKRDVNPSYLALVVVDIVSGEQRELTPVGFNDSQPVWSPDARSLAVISDRGGVQGTLYQVDAQSGEGQPIVPISDYVEMPPTWSDDGRWIAVYAKHYVGRTSSISRTYIVSVPQHSIVSYLEAFQTALLWQPG